MIKMLRVLFDTNIYGLLIDEPDAGEIQRKIRQEKDFIVYGYAPIRKEIRDIPKITKLSRKARIQLLNIYDRIVGKHILEHSLKITYLAKKYFSQYRNLGGTYGWDTSIRVDFMIVACASYYGLDIVYSADKKTLLGKKAKKAYQHINIHENLRTPYFLEYSDLMHKFKNHNL